MMNDKKRFIKLIASYEDSFNKTYRLDKIKNIKKNT